MKKVLLAAVLVLTAGMVANAQPRLGVKAGASISNMALDNYDGKLGFTSGVFGEFKIAKFAVQPEVLYNLQGAKYDIYGYGGKVELSYLSIPVMAKYYVTPSLSIEAGPQLGFLLSAKDKQDDGGDDIDLKDGMEKTDLAINFGVSYELPMIPIGVFARYSLGLTDLMKVALSESDAGKNRTFQAGVFVKF